MWVCVCLDEARRLCWLAGWMDLEREKKKEIRASILLVNGASHSTALHALV